MCFLRQEFKAIILEMLEKAKQEYKHLRDIVTHDSSNDIEDTSPTFKIMEEGATALSKEEAGALAQRQYKFIQNLEAALIRIQKLRGRESFLPYRQAPQRNTPFPAPF